MLSLLDLDDLVSILPEYRVDMGATLTRHLPDRIPIVSSLDGQSLSMVGRMKRRNQKTFSPDEFTDPLAVDINVKIGFSMIPCVSVNHQLSYLIGNLVKIVSITKICMRIHIETLDQMEMTIYLQ